VNAADRLGPEHEALILAELARRVKDRIVVLRAVIGTCYAPGDKHTFRSPIDDQKLGSVWRTDPDPKWQVVDRDALDAWLITQDRYRQEKVRVRPDCWPEALACLASHAPDTLEDVVRIRDTAVDEVLAECARRGVPVAPGVDLVKPEGVLTVKPAPTAGEAIAGLVRAGVVDWEGRPALDAGEAAS